jgi:maltose/moltooligosaccharide transporter
MGWCRNADDYGCVFNIAMEPFRALVGDNLRTDQRTLGFSVQTALIGFGAVIGSWLPYVLTNWFGVSNRNEDGVPMHLILSFVLEPLFLLARFWFPYLRPKNILPMNYYNLRMKWHTRKLKL